MLMASWDKFACPLNFPPPPIPPSQPPIHRPPDTAGLSRSALNFPPPPIPPLVPPPFFPTTSPPVCNTAVPPPPVLSLPPPSVLMLVKPPLTSSNYIPDPEEKFSQFKILLEGRFKKINKAVKLSEQLKVSDIKETLIKCFSYIEQLESLVNCLQITYKLLPQGEWLGHSKNVEEIKTQLMELLQEITNPDALKIMKKVVQKRKKKRDYRRRKVKEWQEQKRLAILHAEQKNRQIDLWLEKMKDEVSRAKREEDIKREADIVLSDVTAKKVEAKRMLNMLNTLAKLRAARAQNLPHGTTVSEHDTTAFNKVIDRLKKMWLDQFNGYKVEEEGLKVMLGHAEEERASIEAAQLRKNLKTWNRVIFGPASSEPPLMVEELITARQEWDMFICPDDAPMASSIPVGWVLPTEPSTKEWGKLL